MSKVWFSVVLGTVALLGLPGMSFAQHMRGRTHGSVQGNMRGGGFHRGFDQRFFDPRFSPSFFDPRFSPSFFGSRFSSPIFDPRFSPSFIDPRFGTPFIGLRFGGF
jgi:hypothetical protein